MPVFLTQSTPLTDAVLNAVAHLPTKSLATLVEAGFFQKLEDKDFMRIAVLLAQKSYDEGGCPIGGVVIDNDITYYVVVRGTVEIVSSSDPRGRNPSRLGG